jgi:hypothetical protein
MKALHVAAVATLLLLVGAPARAEPYIAVESGLKCVSCHANPTGGGLRNPVGHAYAQNELAARRLDTGESQWIGQLSRFFSIGGDLRASGTGSDVPDGVDEDLAFAVDELRAYLDVSVIADRLSVYVDQRLAPGASDNREAYARAWLDTKRSYYVKAGKMYLPYGLRLEDDTAFIRQVTGISFDTPDNGVELGLETGPWSAQLAVSNGTAGGPEADSGKQWSLRGEFVQATWRLGASYNLNDADGGDRHLAALFAGLRTGSVAWIAEVDYVEDKGLVADPRRQWIGLIEANWAPRKGHNLKLTVESLDPDTDVDDDYQDRFSLVWEYTPMPYLQLRGGVRIYEGVPQVAQQNRRFGFIELHGFF